MTSRLSCGAFMLATLSIFPAMAQADFKPEQIRRGKRATALVIAPSGNASGTAFCIDATGVFITNAHVVKTTNIGFVALVLNASDVGEKRVAAEVIRVDQRFDLAVLYSKEAAKLKLTGAVERNSIHTDPDPIE